MKEIKADEVRKVIKEDREKRAKKTMKKEQKKVDKAINLMVRYKRYETPLGKKISLQMQEYAEKLGYTIKKYSNLYFLSTEPRYFTTK